MEQIFGYHYETPVGTLGIAVKDGALCRIVFGRLDACEEKETKLHRRTKLQLDEYFDGKRHNFDLPLVIEGTEFQKRVWTQLQKIPYGETRSYQEIAKLAGCPKGARAVGMANRNNPIPIVIPCHRVIGSNGSLVGFMGGEKRMDLKERLLLLEQNNR